MSNAGKTAEILRLLRTQTNGMVVEAMSARGTDYPLSYGVAAASIKEVAARYAPDHGLARTLYCSDVRELRLAALYIADPARMDISEAGFWAEGISSPEVAEHAGMAIGRCAAARDIVPVWLSSSSAMVRYAALMSGAAAVMANPSLQWDAGELIPLLERAAPEAGNPEVKGLAAFIGRLWQRQPAVRDALGPMLQRIEANPACRSLWLELEWRVGE